MHLESREDPLPSQSLDVRSEGDGEAEGGHGHGLDGVAGEGMSEVEEGEGIEELVEEWSNRLGSSYEVKVSDSLIIATIIVL